MTSHDEVAQTIGSRVRAARAVVGISRKRLAEVADVSERYLNQLENGEANVSVGILSRVADALAVDLLSLMPSTRASEGHVTSDAGVSADLSGAKAIAKSVPMYAPLVELVSGMSLCEQKGAIPLLERYLRERSKALRGIALLGLRGAGKSTIGGLYAARHGLPFISVTREIETRAGMALNDLFNLGGPEAYRTLENDVVHDLAGRNDRVVLETAGGIVSNGAAMDVILASFRTVWLKASPEEHLERVILQGDMRPMQSTPKALEHLKTLLAHREQEYARADCVLDTTGRTPAACVDDLERLSSQSPAEAGPG